MKWRPRRKWKEPPYFKVQLYNEILQAWKDEAMVFDKLVDVQDFIKLRFPTKKSRIILIESRNNRVIYEPEKEK